MKNILEDIGLLMEGLKSLNPYFAEVPVKPLKEESLREFEVKHKIRLPKDYRNFLLKFGDEAILPSIIGGKSLSLENSIQNGIWKSFAGPLNEAFRYQGTQAIGLEWNDEKDDYADPQPLKGTLCLGSGGCDILWLLIVTGKDSGKVWRFSPDSEKALHPTGLDFLNWAKENLKRKLGQTKKENELKSL